VRCRRSSRRPADDASLTCLPSGRGRRPDRSVRARHPAGGSQAGLFHHRPRDLGCVAPRFLALLAHRWVPHPCGRSRGEGSPRHCGRVLGTGLALHDCGGSLATGWGETPGRDRSPSPGRGRDLCGGLLWKGCFSRACIRRCIGTQGSRPGIPSKASSAWKPHRASWCSGPGHSVRRSLVLILQDALEPRGSCARWLRFGHGALSGRELTPNPGP
jgi:hypothetical protein